MSDGTSIEWTDASWNPLRARATIVGGGTGWACTKVSPGCKHCYAETMNRRLGTGLDYTVGALEKVETYLDEDAIDQPYRWKKPRRAFLSSMTDIFGEWVPDIHLRRMWQVMRETQRYGHQFQVLTKRPRRMREFVQGRVAEDRRYADAFLTAGLNAPAGDNPGMQTSPAALWARAQAERPFRNIWLGTSVEDQERADERVGHLLTTPAAIRFLSCEPLLGPIDLSSWLSLHDDGDPPLLDWVIVGGESGPKARPLELNWITDLIDQCQTFKVAIFVKQLGTAWSREHLRVFGKGGDPADWPEELRVRTWPQ